MSRYYERMVKQEASKSGVAIEYKVTPMYDRPRTVPYEYRVNVTKWLEIERDEHVDR